MDERKIHLKCTLVESIMVSHLMEVTKEKPLINADSRSSKKKRQQISFNEKRSKGFSSRKAHITFFEHESCHKCAINFNNESSCSS